MQRVRLRGGQHVWLRVIEAADAADLQGAFARLSEQSRYERFLTGTPHLTDALATVLADVDHVDREAVVALPHRRSRNLIGVARYARDAGRPDEADLAVTVADAWQGRGLGTTLVAALADLARANGVRVFTVDMLAGNSAMRALARSAGGEAEVDDGPMVSNRIRLGHRP